jgi:hypothetical protein
MKRIRFMGLAIVAVFAFSVVGVASAAAHNFEASKTGELKGKALNTHTFKTNAGTVECKKADATGTVAEPLVKETQVAKVKYSECKAFGVNAEVSEAEYEFNANESVSVIGKTITVKAGLCTVTVEPVAANAKLKTVTYANLAGGKLEVKSNVEKITYKTNAGCVGGAGTFANGHYEGNEEVELVGGTIKWV